MYSSSPSYHNYEYNQYPYGAYSTYEKDSGDRFIGAGLLAPFLLGGLAGAAVAPAFYRPYPFIPYAPYPYPYPYPYPRVW